MDSADDQADPKTPIRPYAFVQDEETRSRATASTKTASTKAASTKTATTVPASRPGSGTTSRPSAGTSRLGILDEESDESKSSRFGSEHVPGIDSPREDEEFFSPTSSADFSERMPAVKGPTKVSTDRGRPSPTVESAAKRPEDESRGRSRSRPADGAARPAQAVRESRAASDAEEKPQPARKPERSAGSKKAKTKSKKPKKDDDPVTPATQAPAPQPPVTAAGPPLELRPGVRPGAPVLHPDLEEHRREALERHLVRDCVDRWFRVGATRVYPASYQMPPPPETLVFGPTADVLAIFYSTWLGYFEATVCIAPSGRLLEIYSLDLSKFSTVEIVAVLQTAIYEAGYSFVNLIHAFANRVPDLSHVTDEEVSAVGAIAMHFLRTDMELYINYLASHAPANPVYPTYNPYAMRKPSSIIASSSTSGAPSNDQSMSTGTTASAARAIRAQDSSVPVLERDRFFRQPGLGAAQRPTHQHPPTVNRPPGYPAHHFPVRAQPPVQPSQAPVAPGMPPAFHQPGFHQAAQAPAPFPQHSGPSHGVQPQFPAQAPAPVTGYRFGSPAMRPAAPVFGAPAPHVPVFGGPVPVPEPPDSRLDDPMEEARSLQSPGFQGQAQPQHQAWTAQGGALAPAGPATVPGSNPGLGMRPFIPYHKLDKFYGDESVTEHKAWWRYFKYSAKCGGWTDAEKCENLQMVVRGVAESWLAQLGSSRFNWQKVSEKFKKEFCTSRESLSEKYFSMFQKKGETARQYLWRLNASATKARIRYDTPERLKDHVTRFIRSLTDSEAKQVVCTRTFLTIEELEETLETYERHVAEPRRRTPSRSSSTDRSSSSRESDRDRDRERSSSRSSSQARVYYAADGGDEQPAESGRRVHFEDEMGQSDSDSADEGFVFQADGSKDRDGRPQHGGGRPGPGHASNQGGGRPNSHYGPGNQGRKPNGDRPRDGSPGPRQDSTCFGCGRLGHWLNECPHRTQCTACNGAGHTAETCRKKCPCCEKVHDRGQCERAKAWADLKAWFKSEAPPGTLPASVLQQLN